MDRRELLRYAQQHIEVPGVAAVLTHLTDSNLRINNLVLQLKVRIANAEHNEKNCAFIGIDRLGTDATAYDHECAKRSVLFATLTTLLQEAGHKV